MPWLFARQSLDAILRAFKADVPADWWANSRELSALLSGQWEDVSKPFLKELLGAVQSRDMDHVDDVISSVVSLGPHLSDAISGGTDAILATLQQKAESAWTLHGRQALAIKDIKGFNGDYARFLEVSHAEQIKRFTELNPGRILHPELVRQAEYLRQSALIRSIDIDLLSEKLTRIVQQQPYWEGLSDVHVARLWHADGLHLANENGVTECYVAGPDDKKTCPVCQRMLGTRVIVKNAIQKITSDIDIKDPEEYARAWRFPRIQDIDNISPQERVDKGYLAPFHGRCRHSNVWLRYGGSPTVKPVTTPADKPGWRLRKGYVDINYPKRFASKADAASWVRLHVANKLLLDKDVSLDFVNSALGHLRLVNQAAPLRQPISSLQMTELDTNLAGRYITKSSGKTELHINKARDAEFMSVAERKARAVGALSTELETWREMKATMPGLSEEIDTSIKLKEDVLKKLKESPVLRPDITFSVSSSISDSPVGGTMVHEYGHAWHYQYNDKVRKQFGLRYYKDRGSELETKLVTKYRVSKYGETNWEETFAENFSLYFHGEVSRMHPDIVKFFDSQFTKLQFGKRLTPEIYEA